ncbi:MAG: SlyX family protein [Desulfovibrio sp.]|jgi:SlyX protein
MTTPLEERLTRLEEEQALRDREVEQLNAVVTEQQKELAELRKRLDLLAGRYRALRESMADNDSDQGEDPLPPHYLPR